MILWVHAKGSCKIHVQQPWKRTTLMAIYALYHVVLLLLLYLASFFAISEWVSVHGVKLRSASFNVRIIKGIHSQGIYSHDVHLQVGCVTMHHHLIYLYCKAWVSIYHDRGMILYIHEANWFIEHITTHGPYGGRWKPKPLVAPFMKSKL